MITKKWVENRLRGMEILLDTLNKQDAEDGDAIKSVKKQIGFYEGLPYFFGAKRVMVCPRFSVSEKIDAICAYLGIEIVKEAAQEKIVAKKISKAKAK